MFRNLMFLLLLLPAVPAAAQTPTFVNLFRIANGGFTPIPNDPVIVGTRVFYRFTIQDVNGNTVPPGNGNFTISSDGVRIGGPFAWPTSTLTFPQQLAAGEHAISIEFVPTTATYSGNSTVLYQSWGPPAGPQTATQLSSSANPSQVGQPVAVTAQVVGMQGNPVTGGSVNFRINGAAFAGNPVAVNATGQAVLPGTAVPAAAGRHTFEATYNPDAAHAGGASTANVLTQNIVQATSTVAVSSSSNPSVAGSNVTFVATVTSVTPNPGGNLTFSVDGSAQPPVALSGNQASFTTASLSPGNHTVLAAYSGNGSVEASNGTLTQRVLAPATATLTSSAEPSEFGQPVTLIATVAGAGPAPTGTVEFQWGSASLGAPVALTNGTARLDVPAANLTVGFHAASFSYSGDANYAPVTATLPGGQVVDQGSTTTTVTSSANTTNAGTPITYTATVVSVAPSTGTPTGNVSFTVNNVVRQTVALTSGAATFTTSLSAGNYSVGAVYSGSSDHTASAGATSEVVNAPSAPPLNFPPATFGLSLALDRAPQAVPPGGVATFYVRLNNTGNQDDSYRFTLSGDPRAHLLEDRMTVGAAGHGEVLVGLTLPPDANPSAVQLVLTAVSERVPDQRATIALNTRVAGQGTFSLALRAGWNGVGFESGSLAALASNPLVLGLAQLRNGAYEILPFEASSVASTAEGSWAFSVRPTTVSYTGAVVSDGIVTLATGWNLVAFPSDGPALVESNPDVLAPFYEIQADNSYRPVEGTVQPGRAYWVFAHRPTVLFYAR